MAVATAVFCAAVPVLTMRFTATADAAATDFTTTRALRVFDATAIKTAALGNAGDTVQVLNAANAITNAIALNAADATVVRAGTINDANNRIAAAGTLRITTVEGGVNCACELYIHCVPA